VDVLLRDLVAVSAQVGATSSRSAKIALLAGLLRQTTASEAALAVSWLSGALPQRQIGVGWAALRHAPQPAADPRLTIDDVDAAFTEIGATIGPGSQARRRDLLDRLLATSTADEQDFLRRLLGGELRQGALGGIMTEAVAAASGVPLAAVRRAAMLRGDLPAVAQAALHGGIEQLSAFRLQVGRPVSPMLAQSAVDVDDALRRLGGRAFVEWKLDGVRVQVHRSDDRVAVFSRTLDDITGRMPEVVELVRGLPARELVLDGEALAVRDDGRPQPFQVTAARAGSAVDGGDRAATRLGLFVFDLLHADGVDLLDLPAAERFDALQHVVPEAHRVPRTIAEAPGVAESFLADALSRGHEGVMVKALDAPYEAGRRGAAWLKVKPVHTLDLVVLAVEWGSGRRRGWLSNIHLGARDPATGGFVMLGKTFKGMTDAMLAWQTERFRELAAGPLDQWAVPLRPEQVVEIAFDGVQVSSRYPGGVALRFARVVRYRDDKPASEADTIETVRAFLPS
jgi:DNA ligase 1